MLSLLLLKRKKINDIFSGAFLLMYRIEQYIGIQRCILILFCPILCIKYIPRHSATDNPCLPTAIRYCMGKRADRQRIDHDRAPVQ